VPDLRGRHAIHDGQGPGLASVVIGQKGGEETVTLTVDQLPSHTHAPNSATSATSDDPTGRYWAPAASGTPYGQLPSGPTKTAAPAELAPTALADSGQNAAHENRMPGLTLSFVIAVEGIFPSRN
jgi:microcystin-dependent protein